MRKEWKVKSVILLSQFSVGLGWICIGIGNLFKGVPAAEGISGVALAVVFVCSILPYRLRQEEPDEMARQHLEKTQAMGYTVVSACLMTAYAVGLLWDGFAVPFQVMAPIFFGVGCVVVGLYFSRLETRGEPWQDW